MANQTVLKTAGGKTLTGSTPVPSAHLTLFFTEGITMGIPVELSDGVIIDDLFVMFYKELRGDANGEQPKELE